MTPEEYRKQGRNEAVAAMLAATGYPFPPELHEALSIRDAIRAAYEDAARILKEYGNARTNPRGVACPQSRH
jgi:hypothetical protein